MTEANINFVTIQQSCKLVPGHLTPKLGEGERLGGSHFAGKLGEERKAFKLVEATLQVASNSGVREIAKISASRAAREDLLADLEALEILNSREHGLT